MQRMQYTHTAHAAHARSACSNTHIQPTHSKKNERVILSREAMLQSPLQSPKVKRRYKTTQDNTRRDDTQEQKKARGIPRQRAPLAVKTGGKTCYDVIIYPTYNKVILAKGCLACLWPAGPRTSDKIRGGALAT